MMTHPIYMEVLTIIWCSHELFSLNSIWAIFKEQIILRKGNASSIILPRHPCHHCIRNETTAFAYIGFEASLGIVIHQPKLGEGSIKAYTTWPLQKRYFTLKAKHAFQYMMGGVTFSNINELFYHPLCDLGISRVWGNRPSTHLAANFFMSA